MQGNSSAIKRRNPSAPARWLVNDGRLNYSSRRIRVPGGHNITKIKATLNKTIRVLDYGCGFGRDADEYNWERYDPIYFPEMPSGYFNHILCTYVLNTVNPIKHVDIIEDVLDKLTPGGSAYFTVRRDITEQKKGRGCIQYPVYLDDMKSIREISKYEIYKYCPNDSFKLWFEENNEGLSQLGHFEAMRRAWYRD